MPDDVAAPDTDTPTARLNAAFGAYQEDVRDASNAGTAMKLCLDAAETFAELEVEASDDNTDSIHAMAKAYLNQLSDTKSGVARKNVRKHWNDKIDELEKKQKLADGEDVYFHQIIRNHLTGVTKKVNTDRSSTEETEYVLEFDAGPNLTVTQSVLFNRRKLWKTYTSSREGEYPDHRDGDDDDRADWDNFVGDVIEKVGEDVEREPGPRTAALQSLEDYVSNTVAYGNRKDAVENGGVYVDAEPPGHDEVVVPREAIASITNTHEITDRALQSEIAARGLSGPSTAGRTVSQSTTVHGNWQTFWYLSGEHFDEVGDYKEEADDPIDRMPDAPGDNDDNNDDDGAGDANTSGDNNDDDGSDDGSDAGTTDDVTNTDGTGDNGDSDGSDEVVNDTDAQPDAGTDDSDEDDDDDREPGKIGSYGPESEGDA